MKLYFDTETTGLYQRQDFHNFRGLPAIMEYAHLLVDDEWNVVETFNTLVQIDPEVEIHPKALEAHGITREECANGLPFSHVAERFSQALDRCRMVVGYNVRYDLDMMLICLHRAAAETGGVAVPFVLPQVVDLMRYATPICQLPGKRPGDFKWPKLTEAMHIICGLNHSNAHRALPDTLACVTLHQHLVNLQESRRHAAKS